MSEEKNTANSGMDEEVVIAADAEVSPNAKVQVDPQLYETIKNMIEDPNVPDVVKFSARLSGEAARLAEEYGPYTFVGNVGRINDLNDQEFEVEAFPSLIGSTYDASYLIGHLLGQELLEDIASARQQALETDGDSQEKADEAAHAAVLLASQRFASLFCTACANDPAILTAFRDAVVSVIDDSLATEGGDLPQ